MILLMIIGFVTGSVLGLSGAGGSILTIPLLVYVASIPLREAFVISLFVVGVTAAFGSIQRIISNEVDFLIAGMTLVTGALGTPLGTALSYYLPEHILMIGFACLMILIGILMWWQRHYEVNIQNEPRSLVKWMLLMGGGVLTGFFSGLFGVGGGFFIVPLLVFAGNLPIQRAMSTSLLIITFISFFSAGVHAQYQGQIPYKILLIFLIGSVAGITCGIQLSKVVSGVFLRKGFAALTLVIGFSILIHETQAYAIFYY